MAKLVYIRWMDESHDGSEMKVHVASVIQVSDTEKRLLLEATKKKNRLYPEYIELKDAHKYDIDVTEEKVEGKQTKFEVNVIEQDEPETKDEPTPEPVKPKAKTKKDFFQTPSE